MRSVFVLGWSDFKEEKINSYSTSYVMPNCLGTSISYKTNFNFEFSFWRFFFDVLGRFWQIFKIILIFEVPVIFENGNFAACALLNF